MAETRFRDSPIVIQLDDATIANAARLRRAIIHATYRYGVTSTGSAYQHHLKEQVGKQKLLEVQRKQKPSNQKGQKSSN